MTGDRKDGSGVCAGNADRVGKVFAVTNGKRRCLICDGLFTQASAAEHADKFCYPPIAIFHGQFTSGAVSA